MLFLPDILSVIFFFITSFCIRQRNQLFGGAAGMVAGLEGQDVL